MKPVDNSEQIASMLAAESDGDAFWYTEILDRSKRTGGDNRRRVLRMFRHECRANMMDMMPTIRGICDATGARAYIRLTPRSHKAVAKELLRLTTDAVCSEQWSSTAYLYARACGRTSIHGRRLWLYDVDAIGPESDAFAAWLRSSGHLAAIIPSRKGCHMIARPHNPDGEPCPWSVSLHKDNPTNLYIPGAEVENV